MVHRRRVVGLVLAGLFLGSCSGVDPNPDPPAALSKAMARADTALVPPEVEYGTRVTLGPCTSGYPVGEGFFAPLIAAAAAGLVSLAFDELGKALAEAGKDDSQVFSAVGVAEVPPGELPPCIQVARGWVFKDLRYVPLVSREVGGRKGEEYDLHVLEPWSLSEESPVELDVNKLASADLLLAARPDFFFEGHILQSSNKTSLTIVPLVAVLNKPVKTYFFNDPDFRVVDMSLSMRLPDAGKEEAGNGEALLLLGPLDLGKVKVYPELALALVKDEAARQEIRKRNERPPEGRVMLSHGLSPYFSFALVPRPARPARDEAADEQPKDDTRPLNLKATVTELRRGNEAYALAAALIGKIGPATADAVKTELARDKEAEAAAGQTALSKFYAAAASAHDALQSCIDAAEGARTSAALKAQSALSALRAAAIAAGRDIAVPTVSIGADDPRAACTQARDQLLLADL